MANLPGKNDAFDLRNRKSTSVTAAQASGVLPAGGAAGTILTKNSSTDYDVAWLANTAIQKGDGIFVRIRNNTGSTLTKGQVVYTNGATGNRVTVALAQANADATSARTLGFISEDILVNDEGWVQIEGYLSGIDTASLTDGSQLYLSPTTAGAFTSTKPVAPNHIVYVAVVAKAASPAGGGAVLVKCQNGYELDEIHDVLITSKTNNDVLQYNSADDTWRNRSLSNAGIMGLAGGTFTGSVTFNQNITGYGTLTNWANQQLSLAVRNGQNAVTNLVQYSTNATTVLGGVTTNGLLWAGNSTGAENNITYNLSATNPYVSSTQATFTTSSTITYQPFAVGQKIIVSGASQAQYNSSWIATAVGGSSGAWTVTVTSPSGTTPFTNGGAITATGTIALEPTAFFKSLSNGTTALTIKSTGTSGTATDVFRYIDGAGALKTYITAAGDIVAPAITAIWSITTSAQDRNVTPLRARFSITNGQNPIQTWESSTTVLAGVNSPGQFWTGSTVPARGSRVTGIPIHTPTGTTDITFTTAAAHNILPGQTVEILGVTPSGYNGVWRAQNGTTGTTLILNIGSNPGPITVAGSAYVSPQFSVIPASLGSVGVLIKAAASQSANLLEVQDSTGAVLANITSVGGYNTNSANGYQIANAAGFKSLNSGQTALITAGTAVGANPHFVVRQSASQTGDLQQWQTSTPTTVAYVRNDGLINSSAGFTGPWAWINGYRANTTLAATANNDSAPTVIFRAVASQTQDLLRFESSTPTTLSYIKPDGSFYVNSNSNNTGIYFKGTASDQSIRANGNDLFITPRFDLIFNPTDTTGRLRPVNDNQADLGTSSQRWKNIYGAGAILNGLTLSSTTSPITLDTSVGTSGQVLTSAGAGATPTWTTPVSATTQNANLLYAGPSSGAAATPTFRQLVANDFALSSTLGQSPITATTGTGWSWITPMANPMTTQGDIIYGGVSGAPLRLAPSGTNNHVLTYDTGTNAPKWAAVPTYTLPTATSTVLGGVELFSDTVQSDPANAVTSTAGKTYGVQLNSSGQMVVNVPWSGGSFTGGTLTSALTLASGGTGAGTAPLYFNASGTSVLSTPVSGAREYDATVFYQTSNTNPGRALDTQEYYYASSADWLPDFSTSSAVQSFLGTSTRGIVVAAGTTYEYEFYTTVRHQYVTTTGISGDFNIYFNTQSGTPTTSVVHQVDYGSNTTGFTTATSMSTVRPTGAVSFMAAISSGSRYAFLRAKGIIRVTGTGTTKIYPGLNPTNTVGDNVWTVQAGTVFKLKPLGNGTVTTVGAWTA